MKDKLSYIHIRRTEKTVYDRYLENHAREKGMVTKAKEDGENAV